MSQQINLYDPAFRKPRKLLSAAAILQGTALVVLLIGVLSFYLSAQTLRLERRAEESAQRLNTELERLKVSAAGQSPQERARLLAERRKVLEAQLAEYDAALRVLEPAPAAGRTGYSGLMRALAGLSMDGVWLTRIELGEAPDSPVSIAGRATRPELVAAYLARLRKSEALSGQQFATLQITRAAAPAAQAGGASAPGFVEFVLSSAHREARK